MKTTTACAARSADASDATAPAYAVGDRIVSLVGHMPGMQGMAGAVAEAHAGAPPYYAINFDEPMGKGNPHRWLTEDEIEAEDAPDSEQSAMDSMKSADVTADRFSPATRENPKGYRTREFTVTAERVGEGDDAPLRIAISSEAPVERWGWDDTLRDTGGIYDEILDHGANGPNLEYVRDGLPFCLDHDLRKQIGIGTTPTLDADGVLRTDVTRGNHPDAAWVFADMAAGVRKKVSIGYWPGERYTQTKRADGKIERRYRGWMLFEASSVAVPADYDVGIGRGAPGTAAPKEPTPAAGEKPQTKESSMSTATTPEPGTAPAPDTRAKDLATLAGKFPGHARLAEWITDGTTLDAARDEVMDKLRKASEERGHTAPTRQDNGVRVGAVHERGEDKPWGETPEQMAQEFTRAVITASRAPHSTDVRLLASAAQERSQNTLVGTEGGFAVPQPVQTMLLEASRTGGEILSRVTERPITVGNAYKETVVKEDARTNGNRNGGLRHYWVAQEGEIPQSQAKLREVDLNLKKVAVAVPVTEEQIEDGPALLSFLQEQVPEELRFGQELSIWGGSGVGECYGAISSGALKTVAIEGSQTIANTSQYIWKNFANMVASMDPQRFLRSAFFLQQSLWAKILTATAGDPANGAVALYVPPGRLADAPFGSVYGRPLIPVEYASAEGTVGDIVLADWSDYLYGVKGGVKYSSSMHVEFLKDKQMLKWTLRCDGQPRTKTPITPFKGSNTLSPYVALAARS